MSAPEIGIGHEVIVDGSSSAQTMQGIGYRRDTVLPCQAGSSVLMARSGGYGGVGSRWARLQNGDRFTVTMGEGRCTYQVTGQRLAGQKAPTPPSGKAGALTLVTATGYPFMPSGVLRIDATLVGKSYSAPNVTIPTGALPAAELALGTDSQQLFPLTMLLEALVALAIVAALLWRRWSPLKTFIVATPVALALTLLTAQNLDLLLPNLI
jgi:sortase A